MMNTDALLDPRGREPYRSIMRFLAIPLLALCIALASGWETAEAASLLIAPSETDERPSPATLRRAERLRIRLQRRDAVDARRLARLRARPGATHAADASRTAVDRVLLLVNEARAAEGLDPLSTHPALERTAQTYAKDMATRGFFAHEDPDGRSSGDRILAGGYAKPACQCSWEYGTGENLAQGQDTPEEAVRDWLASPGHRKNIMSTHFEDTGIGYFEEHWVQHFGVSNVLP